MNETLGVILVMLYLVAWPSACLLFRAIGFKRWAAIPLGSGFFLIFTFVMARANAAIEIHQMINIVVVLLAYAGGVYWVQKKNPNAWKNARSSIAEVFQPEQKEEVTTEAQADPEITQVEKERPNGCLVMIGLTIILSILFAALVFAYSYFSTPDEPKLPPVPVGTYSIISDENLADIKRSVDVLLVKKVNKQTLQNIAMKIKSSDYTRYDRTFIGYRLKGASADSAYWATTHFDPNLNVRIIGLSLSDESKLRNVSKETKGRTVIGSWLFERSSSRVDLYAEEDDLWYMESSYVDGSNRKIEKVPTKLPAGTGDMIVRLDDVEPNQFGEYIIIRNGVFEYWGKNGMFATATPL